MENVTQVSFGRTLKLQIRSYKYIYTGKVKTIMIIIGITAYYHDSSACLFIDNELVFACEEEKFSGIKHDSSFPHKTVDHIFKTYNLTKSDIDCVCYYEDPKLRLKRKKSYFKSLINVIKVRYNIHKISKNVHYTPHHISHMTYSYLSSSFNDAVIVSVDGVGETTTVSIGKGENGKITQLKTIDYPNSFGLFYSAMTAFLGFKPNEGEYKVMGLASYGNPHFYRKKLRKLFDYWGGELKCNMEYFNWDRSSRTMFNEKLETFLGMETRLPVDPITQNHKNLAASVQEAYEMSFFYLLKESKRSFYSTNLCLGGGCAYNGRANGKIYNENIFKEIWIPPAPSDAGSSIGSCLDYITRILGQNVRVDNNPFLGPSYTENEIFSVIQETEGILYKKYTDRWLLKNVAKYLKSGLIVGWFQDRIEFGARALGNRSILANPTISTMKDDINKVIKKREGFRPFAPMVTFEDQSKYFNSSKYIPYMNQVVDVKKEYIDKLPAVTHIDGTARVQSVKQDNPIYYLLKEFEKLSEFPILLNTSFNVKDKTMVLTPKDAMDTFLDTKMDVLVMGAYVIYKL